MRPILNRAECLAPTSSSCLPVAFDSLNPIPKTQTGRGPTAGCVGRVVAGVTPLADRLRPWLTTRDLLFRPLLIRRVRGRARGTAARRAEVPALRRLTRFPPRSASAQFLRRQRRRRPSWVGPVLARSEPPPRGVGSKESTCRGGCGSANELALSRNPGASS